MKRIQNFIQVAALISVAVFFLSSCASTSGASSEKSEAAKGFDIPQDKGVVYVYRTGRMVGAMGSTQIKVNGQNAGGTSPNSFFRWELKPGTYVFSAATTESSAAVEVDVKPGNHYFIMQSDHMGVSSGRVSMKLMDDPTGMKAVKSGKLLVSTYIPEK